MITVTMRLLAAEGRDEELAAVLRRLCAHMRCAVPGCRRSEASRSPHRPRRFLLVTCFDDAAAHAAHANSEAYGASLPDLMECLEGLPDIEIYQDL